MAQIGGLIEAAKAKADLDAAVQVIQGAYSRSHDERLLQAKTTAERIRKVLEERWTTATQIQPTVADWLKRVRVVASDITAIPSEESLQGGSKDGDTTLIARMLPCVCATRGTTTTPITLDVLSDKLDELMLEYDALATMACCTEEQPSHVGQQTTSADLLLARDDDMRKIIGIITQAERERKSETETEPVILPIIGPAGIGKTTLVKSIFSDPNLFRDYAKAWVDLPRAHGLEKICTCIISDAVPGGRKYLEEEEDHLKKEKPGAKSSPGNKECWVFFTAWLYKNSLQHLLQQRNLMEAAGSSSSKEQQQQQAALFNSNSLDKLKKKVLEHFGSGGNKKLLLVLDNLWEEDAWWSSVLSELKSFLGGIGRNLVVIATTPSQSIADYMSSTVIEPYQLRRLSDDMCWAIIKGSSGFEETTPWSEAAERIGREIASKCCGLPLAAQALGRFLGTVNNPEEWQRLLGGTKDIWNVGYNYHDSKALLPPSYSVTVFSHLKEAYPMSPYLSLRFATCAFCFSKSRSISRHELDLQLLALHGTPIWSLLDFSLLREELASSIITGYKDTMLVTMDDVMRGFARYLLGDKLIVVDGRNGATPSPDGNNNSTSAYLAVISNWDGSKQLDLSSILPAPAGILALRFQDCPETMELSDGAFSCVKQLRFLDLSGCCLKNNKLPESIGQLKCLGYLNAPGIQDRVLPLWLTRLRRLIYLNLRGSCLLSDLTEAFMKLTHLRHLDLSGCSGIKALLESLGRLHDLEHLDLSRCSGLKELPESLGCLRCLKRLDLSRCSGLQALPDSFGMLEELCVLDLSGCSCVGGVTEEALRHLTNLRYLNLSHRCGYSSVEDWFHLKHLHKVLPQLRELEFLGLSSCLNPLCYTSTPDKSNSYVDRCIKDLAKLEHLDLSHNKFLVQLPDSIGYLKDLRSLDLSGCLKLERLPESIGNLRKLRALNLSGCLRLQSLPKRIGELKTLEILDLSGCPQFEQLPENVQQKLAKLRSQGTDDDDDDDKVHHLCHAAGAHEDQSQERSIIAGDDQAQGSASTPQASFVDRSSAAEQEITEATDDDQ